MNKTHQPAGQMQLSMELFFLVLKILEQKESSFFSSFSIVATQLKLTKWVPNEEKNLCIAKKIVAVELWITGENWYIFSWHYVTNHLGSLSKYIFFFFHRRIWKQNKSFPE